MQQLFFSPNALKCTVLFFLLPNTAVEPPRPYFSPAALHIVDLDLSSPLISPASRSVSPPCNMCFRLYLPPLISIFQ